MFRFSLALALPFMLFSAFPGWLNSPQSGSWLNSVKVVLGLLEIGFAFKFLSTPTCASVGTAATQLFLAIWVVVALCVHSTCSDGSLPPDSKTERMSLPIQHEHGLLYPRRHCCRGCGARPWVIGFRPFYSNGTAAVDTAVPVNPVGTLAFTDYGG